MPAEKYTRWQSTREEEDPFPELEEEFEVDCPSEDNGSRVATVLRPRQQNRFRKRRVPLSIFGYRDFSPKAICIIALSCSLCITIGLLLGYALNQPRHTTKDSNKEHSDASKILPAPQQEQEILPFGGRDFSKATAVKFQSYLTSQMVNAYARRLNRIPESQVAYYVASTLGNQGFTTRTMSFSATVSTPDESNANTVEALHTNGSVTTINQPVLADGTLPYAAYSFAGDVEGFVVYGHRGSLKDLLVLRQKGVVLRGAILLLQHCSDTEGAQVRRAEVFGAAGVLLYPDPSLFRGNDTAYPHGTGLPRDGVISPNLKLLPGDPSTPHYPSFSNVYKKPQSDFEEFVPKIPVQPISYNTARIILDALDGPVGPSKWTEDLVERKISVNSTNGDMRTVYTPLQQPLGGEWKNTSTITRIRLKVHNLLTERRITNVHAWLPCQDASKVVHIGTSQGSSGGAGVGLASLLAIGESMSRSLTNGTGRRVVLSAWAESKLGWIGSTEFTELHAGWLEATALAYFDISSTVGALKGIRVQATPLLHEALREAAHFVAWPEQEALSLIEGWRLGSGREYDIAFENVGCWSDAVSFGASLGVPSVQVSVEQPKAPASCTEEHCDSCYGSRKEFPLSRSQYDTTEAAVELLDPNLDWTTAMATLVGVSSLVLTETPLPPVDFKGDFSGSLVDGWWSFLHHHLPALNHTQYNFTDILDTIRNELYVLQTEMVLLDAWYKTKPIRMDPYYRFRHDEDRVAAFMRVSRGMLGPRGIARLFTNTLAGAADPVEDPLHSLHHMHFHFNGNVDNIPHNIMAIQTNEGFSDSSYNNLAFSNWYNEENKPRPHSWFPQVSHTLSRVLSNKSSWENLHGELSLLLAAVKSFKNLIPLQL